ncbi:MAG: hypothetical protein WCK98_01085 [bacterium]
MRKEKGFAVVLSPEQIRARNKHAEQQRKEATYELLNRKFATLSFDQQHGILATLCDDFGYDLTQNPLPFAIVAETISLVCIVYNDRNVFAYRTLNEARADQRKSDNKKLTAGAIAGQQMTTNGYNPADEILSIAYERNSWRVFVRYLLINLIPEIEEVGLGSHLDENILNVVRDYTLGQPFQESISFFKDHIEPEFLAILELVSDRSKIFDKELFGTGQKRMDEREQITLNTKISSLIQDIIKILQVAIKDISQTHANFEASPISTKGNQSARIIPKAAQYNDLDKSSIESLRTTFAQNLSLLRQNYPQLF